MYLYFRFGKRSSLSSKRDVFEANEASHESELEPEIEKLFRSIDMNGNHVIPLFFLTKHS